MYYIGIDVGGTNLVAGLVNEKGHILDKVSHPVDKSMTAEELCHELARLAQKVCEMGAVPYEQIEAVGVGLPGLVDNETGVVVQTPNMAFSDTPFRKLFQEVWNVPVFLANDANCAAIYYYTKNKDKYENVTTVTYVLNDQPFGIGLGLIIEGKLFRGADGCAGEYYEKDSFLKESKYGVRDNLVPVVEKLLNHMKMTAYLLNPVKLIICGNAFSAVSDDDLRQLEKVLSSLPCTAELKCEPHFSAPACGAALIGADSYVREIVGGIEKRWS